MKKRSMVSILLVCFLLCAMCGAAFAEGGAVQLNASYTLVNQTSVQTAFPYELIGSDSYPYLKTDISGAGNEDFSVHTATGSLTPDIGKNGDLGSISFYFTSGNFSPISFKGNSTAITATTGSATVSNLASGQSYQFKTELSMKEHTYQVTLYDETGENYLGGMTQFADIV